MRWLSRYKAVLLLVLLFSVPFLAWFYGLDIQTTIHWIREQGMRAFLVTIPAHVFLSISPASSDPIALTNGFIYGLFTGAIVNWIGSMLGSVFGYWLIYLGAREVKLDQMIKRLPAFLQRIPVSSPLFLIGVRFVPIVGSDVVKYAAPIYRVPFYRFAWTSAIAIIPWAFLMAAIGSGASNIFVNWLH